MWTDGRQGIDNQQQHTPQPTRDKKWILNEELDGVVNSDLSGELYQNYRIPRQSIARVFVFYCSKITLPDQAS
jgi:hypothetical protein